MIQRIQSIFLLLAGGASLGLFGLPLAKTPQPIEESAIFADAVYNLNDQVALMVLFGLAGAMALIGIFLFRNRPLQMKVSLSALIINLGGLAFGAYYLSQNITEAGEKAIQDGLGMYLPLVSIFFAFLAYRFIRRDDKLVKSMDRLR
jgi:hypothetical protein